MSCHPDHIELAPLDLPPLDRRPKLLRAGRLRAQGRTFRQIAEQMGCSPNTVGVYLEEFERHRFRLLQTVAVDQLLDSILEVVAPTDDDPPAPVRDRLQAARELRLLLNVLPDYAAHDEQQRHAQVEYDNRARAWQAHAELETQQQQDQAAADSQHPANQGTYDIGNP